jgi:hypothetical protein
VDFSDRAAVVQFHQSFENILSSDSTLLVFCEDAKGADPTIAGSFARYTYARSSITLGPVCEEISISRWLSANPASLIADNFGISDAEVARLLKKVLGFIQ